MTEEANISETKKKSFRARVTESTWVRLGVATVVVGLMVGAMGGAGYFYRAYKKTLSEKDSLLSQLSGKAPEIPEVESVVASVSKLIDLPQGETPTLATVSDKSKLESQTFFKRAENGDKVLIYTAAGKAILFRPSTGKVVDMTAINTTPEKKQEEAMSTSVETSTAVDGQAETQEASEVVEEKIFSVAIVNGTTTTGLAKKTGETIRSEFPSVNIVKMADAKKKEYTKTTIVDVSGKLGENAQKIAELLKGEVGALPEGEVAPAGTDIFVLVGEGAQEMQN